MSAYLDERYFDWLYGQVCSVRAKNPASTYRNLLHILYTKEFVWLVPNDDNRIEDGKDLRYEFLEYEGIRVNQRDKLWIELGCSMLELLIALSRRLDFETGKSAKDWFWELLENLDLKRLNDRARISHARVDDILNRVIWRTYEYNGGGGLFPLVRPERDQRHVELWYQLNAYILERY
ncbi:MAG: hypothetical protein LC687_02075 [Actinobacteria bacterium]|nr:hypothetical protein [Actinomycetota bacterium]MCA1806640.1 hypothetical protein [Actinomycetota bacterium]